MGNKKEHNYANRVGKKSKKRRRFKGTPRNLSRPVNIVNTNVNRDSSEINTVNIVNSNEIDTNSVNTVNDTPVTNSEQPERAQLPSSSLPANEPASNQLLTANRYPD
eukprot:TCONS_00031234-protein